MIQPAKQVLENTTATATDSSIPTVSLTLIHHASCSKSQCLYQYLMDQKIPFTLRDYLSSPLTQTELMELINRLKTTGTDPRAIIRLTDGQLSEWISHHQATQKNREEILIQLLTIQPELLQRPILLTEKAAIIGRPFDKARAFLSQIMLNDC